jgi:ribose-phosphate pyrophosphokinase
MSDGLVLFALAASGAFGTRVAEALGVGLGAHEEREFEDGEHKVRPLVNVRGRDVYVIHGLYGDAAQTVNDKLVRLLFFVGALRDASAGRITAVVPYLAYARKDRKSKPRDPVTTRYVAQLFEAVGVDRVVSLDVHNLAAYQNAFRCRAEHLEAAPLFVRHLAATLQQQSVTVVSPDAGGIKRADDFRRRLGLVLGRPIPLAFAEKYRSEGTVSGDAFVGDVEGRTAIIVDDLISSGTTMARTAAACRTRGARSVYAVASHGIFAAASTDVLRGEVFDQIVVTDSVPPMRAIDQALEAKFARVSVTGLFAQAIMRLHGDGSLVELGAS